MHDRDSIIAELKDTIEKQTQSIGKQRQIIEKQRQRCEQLTVTVHELREEIARLKKNSSNSSKPPSSDIVKPPGKKPKGKKRRRGGQKGQARRESKLTLEQAQDIRHYHPDNQPCPKCGTHLVATDEKEPMPSFQYELPERPVTLTAHVAHAGKCPHCNTIRYAKLPQEIRRGGLFGPRLTAFLAMLRAEGNASVSGCQKVLGAMDVQISTGALCKKFEAMSRALRKTYETFAARLPHETRLNIDETTLPQDGKKLWVWAFVAKDFTFFKIDPSRSTTVLEAVLGPDCRAIIGSDLFGAYTKFAKTAPVQIQLCWAHLIRDLKLIAESPSKTIANYGERMLGIAKRIFHTWHRRGEANAKRTECKLERLKTEFLQTGTRTKAGGLARTMRLRLTKHGPRYFTFLGHRGVEPTNNVAEQQIRQCVLSRRVTQGVRGETGRRFWERIWTVLAILRRRGQDAFAFLSAATSAYFNSQPAPSL